VIIEEFARVDLGITHAIESAFFGSQLIDKWYAAEIAVKVADEAIQLHGGYGILEEYDVAHYWRNAKVLEIFEGSKEVKKVIIAKKIIGRFKL